MTNMVNSGDVYGRARDWLIGGTRGTIAPRGVLS